MLQTFVTFMVYYTLVEDLGKSQQMMEALLSSKTEMEDEVELEFRSSVEESYGIPTAANTSIILGLRQKK